MENRKHIQHYRNGKNSNVPAAENLYNGEIAVQYTANNEKLYIKNSIGTVIGFSADSVIEDKISEQDAKVSQAIGLSANTLTTGGATNYEYKPSSNLLKGFNTMNESVDYLAGELENCLTLIETLKANAYMIDTDFQVTPNSNVTSETVSFSIKNNGNLTVPQSVKVTKAVNDGAETTIINSEGQSTGSTTSTIQGAKERFTITVQPNLTGAMSTKVEATRYVCYVGSSSLETMTESAITGLTKTVSDGVQMEKSVTTLNGDYIWICVPEGLRVYYVTSEGMTVSLTDTKTTVSTSMGNMVCYRNYQKLSAHTWDIVIKHQNTK